MTVNDATKTGSSDGSQSDTNSLLSYIAGKGQDGWVATVGTAGGSYTWTSQIDLSPNGLNLQNAIKIQSAGGSSNKTTITFNFSGNSGILLPAINNKLCQLTGFIIKTGAGQTLSTGALGFRTVTTGTAANAFRIDHCQFDDCAGHAIGILYDNVWNSGAAYGLIDQNTFNTTGTAHNGIYIFAGTSQASDTALGEWNGDMTWGTVNTVCVENNTFNFSGASDYVEGNPAIDSAYFGARWLARYNTFNNWVCVSHGADSAPSSTLQVEMFHNIFNLSINNAADFIMYTRGGSLRFYDNTVNLSNGASLPNQIIKTAIDTYAGRSTGFQQIGHGAVGGTETVVPDYIWGNTIPGGTGPLVGQPISPNQSNVNVSGMFVNNTQYFLSAPSGFSELVYPHPLNTDGGSGTGAPISNGFKQRACVGGGF